MKKMRFEMSARFKPIYREPTLHVYKHGKQQVVKTLSTDIFFIVWENDKIYQISDFTKVFSELWDTYKN